MDSHPENPTRKVLEPDRRDRQLRNRLVPGDPKKDTTASKNLKNDGLSAEISMFCSDRTRSLETS
jgi:hypothetical protein